MVPASAGASKVGRMQNWCSPVPPSPVIVPASSCSSRRCFKTSKWISFTYDLGTSQMAAFVLSPRWMSQCVSPLRAESPFPISLMFSWMQTLLAFKDKPFALQGEALCSSLPPVGCHARAGFWARTCLCLSYLSQCGLFILCCGGAAQLILRSFPEGVALYVSVDLLYT